MNLVARVRRRALQVECAKNKIRALRLAQRLVGKADPPDTLRRREMAGFMVGLSRGIAAIEKEIKRLKR